MLHVFDHSNLNHLIQAMGYIGLFLIIFAETGLFFGFFFPGDSLIFIAGLLASRGIFKIGPLIIIIITAAFIGYLVGYLFGKRIGLYLLKKKDGRFYKQQYLLQAKKFYDQYGPSALIIGRLMPIVRTFVPVVAGMIQMPWLNYLICNIIGACLWGGLLTWLGFFLGGVLPNPEVYVYPIVFGIILLSIMPIIYRLVLTKLSN